MHWEQFRKCPVAERKLEVSSSSRGTANQFTLNCLGDIIVHAGTFLFHSHSLECTKQKGSLRSIAPKPPGWLFVSLLWVTGWESPYFSKSNMNPTNCTGCKNCKEQCAGQMPHSSAKLKLGFHKSTSTSTINILRDFTCGSHKRYCMFLGIHKWFKCCLICITSFDV